jgi:hypothetical protein
VQASAGSTFFVCGAAPWNQPGEYGHPRRSGQRDAINGQCALSSYSNFLRATSCRLIEPTIHVRRSTAEKKRRLSAALSTISK